MAIKIRVVNMIPQSVSNETNQDSEPDLAVHPGNPWQLSATTSLTPDPGGSTFAPIFVSRDRGHTWTLNPLIPGSATFGGTTFGTGDVTLRHSRQELAVTPIRADNGNMLALRTADPFTATSLQTIDTVPVILFGPDQPFVRTMTVTHGPDTGKDRVYLGFNNLNLTGATSSIDVSADGEASSPVFTRVVIESRSTGAAGQDGPAVRPAVHSDGTVYAAFMGWRAPSGTTTDVVVVRDDHWGIGGTPFQDLVDTDGFPGLRVALGVTNLALGTILGAGQERVGNDLTIAVDPRKSSRVFIAWCDVQVGVYTLHVRASEDRGKTWSPTDLLTVTNVTNPAIAINDRGKVGLVYQQLTTTLRWETHVRFSKKGAHWDDYVLSTTPAGVPVANPLIGPYLGDYEQLLTQGTDFYGVFCANNTPDLANFPQGVHYQRNADFTTNTLLDVTGLTPVAISIDPFFFHISWDEEKEEEEEEREHEFEGGQLRVKGLKYEKLEISGMDLNLGEDDDQRHRRLRDRLRHVAERLLGDEDDDRD
jgi:hypothetical protein